MKTTIIFDMDGTIADLYNVSEWLERLRNNDETVYTDAQPLFDMEQLRSALLSLDVDIMVVSWGSKSGDRAFNYKTRKAKVEWLKRYNFPVTKIHVVKYGTPKSLFRAKEGYNILVDDNENVRAEFSRFNNCEAIHPNEFMEVLSAIL